MKKVQIAAGCKTRLVRRRFSSVPMTYAFNAVPASPDDELAGTVEVNGSDWIFPKPVQRMPLQPSNTVVAGAWDTFFSVDVIPDVDIVVTMPLGSLKGMGWLIGLILVIAVVAIAILLLTAS